MVRPKPLLLMLAAVLCGLFLSGGKTEALRAEVSPQLRAALADGAPVKIWVYFRDKGLAGSDLTTALARTEAALNPRAARRRAKMVPEGASLVTAGDLPVNADYLSRAVGTGAELLRESRWLNAASFRAGRGAVGRLAALPEVARLELVGRSVQAGVPTPVLEPPLPLPTAKSPAGSLDYGANLAPMQQANVIPLHDQGLSGAGVVVGLLDTGFRVTHEALTHIPVLGAWDFVGDDGNVDTETGDLPGTRNHGTMVLSVMAGNTPGQLIGPAYGAAVVLARTEDIAQEVPAEEDDWVAGLEWLETMGADIVSSSLGYQDWYVFEDFDGNTAPTSIAADLAVGRGLVVLNSIGNDRLSSGLMIAPADGDSVIAVGGVDIANNLAAFSSPGPAADGRIKPDVSALAVSNPLVDPNDDLAYGSASGTSFSCPLTSGVVALMLERVPGLTPIQIREALRQTASQAGTPDNDYGWGIIDAWAAANWFGPVFAHDLLPDTPDGVGPYAISAVITDREGLNTASPQLVYRIDGGGWVTLPLAPSGPPDTYAANIPGQAVGTTIEYYLEAVGSSGLQSGLPARRAEAPHAFEIQDWAAFEFPWVGPASVPDGVTWGLDALINVPVSSSGQVVSVAVDIELDHPDMGEIEILLIGPDSSQVTLYYRGDPGVSGLVGNWPQTLAVAGPGSLADFFGGSNKGDWTLKVVDPIAGNTGTLQSWTLHFVLANYVTAVPDIAHGGLLLSPNVPNPFNPRTEIRFELARSGRTRLTIFDARGMVVRRLLDTDLGTGRHTRTWDGRDDAGRALGSGTYLYRLESDGEIVARKMLLIR